MHVIDTVLVLRRRAHAIAQLLTGAYAAAS